MKIINGIKDPSKGYYFVSKWINYNFGKLFFKNAAGFTRNVGGIIETRKYKKSEYKVKDSIKPLIDELKTEGIISLGKIYDDSQINQIMEKYEKLITDDKYSIPRAKNLDISNGKNPAFSRQINKAYKNLSEINLLLNDQIKEMVEAYYGGNFQVMHVMCWRNQHVPESYMNTEVYSERWHCDGRKTSILKLFVNLSNVTEDSGPFLIQKQSRTKKLIKMGFGNRHNYRIPMEVVEDPTHVIKAIGPAGSAFLCNTELCLHRASIPNKGHTRDIVQFQFVPSDVPLTNDWYNNIEPIESERIKDGMDPSIT